MTANGLTASEFLLGTERPTSEAAAQAPSGAGRPAPLRKLKALDGGLAQSSTDGQLVARAQVGDGIAFRELVRRHQKRVYQLVFSVVKEQELAMDLVQDTFLKVHQNLAGFKGDAAFYTWTYRIAYNLAIDARRRQQRFDHVEIDETTLTDGDTQSDPYATTSPSPQKAALRRELSAEIQRALATLNENHRAILVLREVDGLSYEELAAAMGIPKGTVMSRLYHARQKLQAALREYVSDDRARA
jgi:RNA polymerase sigma-70 factor (ECF subfamily)